MAFYYIESDGKTCTEYAGVQDFKAKHDGDSPDLPSHVCRVFAVPASSNAFITVDPDTGRYVYSSGGAEVRF